MDGQIVAIAVLSILGVGLYMLPSFVAAHRKCQAGPGIVILNLLLGWTLIAWVGALIWAAIGVPKPTLIASPASTV